MLRDFISPKEAAIQAATHSQTIYSAIRNRRLRVRRQAGKVLIDGASFRRWKAALETRRRLRAEDQAIVGQRV